MENETYLRPLLGMLQNHLAAHGAPTRSDAELLDALANEPQSLERHLALLSQDETAALVNHGRATVPGWPAGYQT
jgi:hypothetical protein